MIHKPRERSSLLCYQSFEESMEKVTLRCISQPFENTTYFTRSKISFLLLYVMENKKKHVGKLSGHGSPGAQALILVETVANMKTRQSFTAIFT